MEETVFSKNSLWYRFATVYGWMTTAPWQTYSICAFVRHVVWGMFLATTVAVVIGLFVGATIGDFGAWIVASIVAGQLLQPDEGAIITITLAAVVCGLVAWYWAATIREKFTTVPAKQPGFVSQAYTSWKEKTCFRVRFE